MATPDSTILIAIKGEGDGAKVIKRDLDDITKKSKSTTESVNVMRNAFGAAFAAFTIRSVVSMADNVAMLKGRLDNATKSAQESTQAFDGLRAIAQKTGSNMETVVSVFQRLSFVREEIKATTAEMLQFTDTVSKLGVVSGASPEALKNGLTQLGQSLSSNIVRAEEFNSIMENIPAVGVSIAEQFGVTTGQLRQLVIQGRVLSEDVFAAMLNASGLVEEKFNNMPITIGRAFAALQSDIELFTAQTASGSGAVSAMIGVIDTLRLSVYGLGAAFNGIVSIIGTAMNLILKTIETSVQNVIDLVNFAIAQANKLPSVNIEKLGNVNFVGSGYSDILKAGAEDLKSISAQPAPQGTVFDRIAGNTGQAAQTSTRTISQNYSDIAKGLSGATSGNEKFNKSLDKTLMATKEVTKEIEDPLMDAINSLGDGLENAFKDGFKSGSGFFDKFLDGAKNTFKEFATNIALQAAKPIVLNVVAAVTGGAIGGASGSAVASSISGGGGGGGLGSLTSVGSSLLNGGLYSSTLGNIGANIGAQFSSNGLLSSSAYLGSQAFGNLGYGALGSLGANLLGLGGGTGGAVGGTLGGLVGGAFGPVGAVAGGFLGSAVGGLFGGGKPKRNTLGGIVNVNSEGMLKYSTNGKDGSKEFISAIVNPLNAIAQALGTTFRGGLGSVETNTNRDKKTAIFHNQVLSGGVGDVNSVIKYAFSRLFDSGTNQQLLDITKKSFTLNRGDVSKVLKDIDLAKFALGLNDAEENISPLKSALDALSDSFNTMKTRASELSLPTDKLTESYEKQKTALIQNVLAPLQDFLDSEALSGSSSLNPAQRLSLARSTFDTNLSAIKGGDLTNIDNITSQASQLLSIGRDVFASSDAFAALESYVRQSISGVAGSLGAPNGLNDSISREIALSTAQQVSIQEQMLVELQETRAENTKLRKTLERLTNQVVIQA
jgi:tape measure domain-containing protein